MLQGITIVSKGKKRKRKETNNLINVENDDDVINVCSIKHKDEKSASVIDSEIIQNQSLSKLTRENWMMGEFDSLLGSGQGRSTGKLEELYSRKRHNIPEQVDLEPGLHRRHRCSSDDDDRPRPPEIKGHLDIAVGDGGRSWRDRASRRRIELSQNCDASPVAKVRSTETDLAIPHWGKKHPGQQKGSIRKQQNQRSIGLKQLEIQSSASENEGPSKTLEERDFSDKGRKRKWKSIDRNEVEYDETIERSGQNESKSKIEWKDEMKAEEDPNVIASQALKCLMAGDNEGYERLEKVKAELIENQKEKSVLKSGEKTKEKCDLKKEIRVLEDVDEKGRYKVLVDSKRSKEQQEQKSLTKRARKKQELMRDDTKQLYDDDDDANSSVADLYQKTRLEGVQNYDKQIENYVIQEGARYRELDDDDVVNSLGKWESKKKAKSTVKNQERRERITDSQRLHQALEKYDHQQIGICLGRCSGCLFCPDGSKFSSIRKNSLISYSHFSYLCFQSFRQCVVKYHLFISPIHHIASSTSLDDDHYQEIRNFQKSLIRFFDERRMACVFVECSPFVVSAEKSFLGGGGHMTIDCFGIDLDRLGEAKAYFRKALSEVGSEWSQHKKIIDVPPERRQGVRGVIPVNFPFFHVDFNLGGGISHVIEDREISRSLGRDIIQGMMEFDSRHDTHYSSHEEYGISVSQFKKDFAPYDWTTAIQHIRTLC